LVEARRLRDAWYPRQQRYDGSVRLLGLQRGLHGRLHVHRVVRADHRLFSLRKVNNRALVIGLSLYGADFHDHAISTTSASILSYCTCVPMNFT
jgi:hypothetical protein